MSDVKLDFDLGFDAGLSLRQRFGPYQVFDRLGEGCLCFVYGAHDRYLFRRVAGNGIQIQKAEAKSRELF